MLPTMIAAVFLQLAVTQSPADRPTRAAEEPVAPYVHANANAGATPFHGQAMWRAFHGRAGVDRVVDRLIDLAVADRRIADIFKGQDLVRLRRTLKEQFCYILAGGCDYSGRTMAASHKDLGIQIADMGALVEDLQKAMNEEHVPFRAQNRLLAKLASMRGSVVQGRDDTEN